jgi:hypothetical protein
MTEPRLQHGWLHAHTTDGCMVAIRADSIDIIAKRPRAECCVITTRGGGLVEVAADERDVRRLICYPPAQEEARPAKTATGKTAGPWEPGVNWLRLDVDGTAVARVWNVGDWWALNPGLSVGRSGTADNTADAKAAADAALIAAGWALS